eukprot:COSAG02_NODE_5376_length_4384_cov_2.010968_2_plen_116_part_00
MPQVLSAFAQPQTVATAARRVMCVLHSDIGSAFTEVSCAGAFNARPLGLGALTSRPDRLCRAPRAPTDQYSNSPAPEHDWMCTPSALQSKATTREECPFNTATRYMYHTTHLSVV